MTLTAYVNKENKSVHFLLRSHGKFGLFETHRNPLARRLPFDFREQQDDSQDAYLDFTLVLDHYASDSMGCWVLPYAVSLVFAEGAIHEVNTV
jgi:hypothetical protein